MSGQFEQRRLARPAYQRGVLDAFAGPRPPRRRGAPGASCWPRAALHEELTRDAAAAQARLDELRALAEDTEGLEPGREDELRAERERLRHVERARRRRRRRQPARSRPTTGRARPTSSRRPSARSRRSSGSRRSSPRPATRCAQAELQLRETASELRVVPASLEAEPGRLEQVEAELDGSPTCGAATGRRPSPSCSTRGEEARRELAALEEGHDPVAAAEEALARAEAEVGADARRARGARGARPRRRSPTRSPQELRGRRPRRRRVPGRAARARAGRRPAPTRSRS